MASNAVAIQEGMPVQTGKTTQLTVRVPTEWIADINTLAQHLSRPGLPVSPTDAVRAALARGLEEYREEFGIKPAPPPPASKPAKKTKR